MLKCCGLEFCSEYLINYIKLISDVSAYEYCRAVKELHIKPDKASANLVRHETALAILVEARTKLFLSVCLSQQAQQTTKEADSSYISIRISTRLESRSFFQIYSFICHCG